MSPSSKFVAAIAFLFTLTACAATAPGLSEADKTAVRAVIDTYVKHANANDWDAWGATLAEDVVFSPPNLAPLKGRAAVVAWAKTFPKVNSLVANVEEVDGRGDVAYTRGTYSQSVVLPDGTPMTEKGTFLEVHRKQADGSWPYTHLMFHSTDPLPPPPPAAVKK